MMSSRGFVVAGGGGGGGDACEVTAGAVGFGFATGMVFTGGGEEETAGGGASGIGATDVVAGGGGGGTGAATTGGVGGVSAGARSFKMIAALSARTTTMPSVAKNGTSPSG